MKEQRKVIIKHIQKDKIYVHNLVEIIAKKIVKKRMVN